MRAVFALVVLGAVASGACGSEEGFDRRTDALRGVADVSCGAGRLAYVADSSSIVRVGLDDGSLWTVAEIDLFGKGPPLMGLQAFAVSADETHAYVVSSSLQWSDASDDDRYAILRIDLGSGDRTELARVRTKDPVSLDKVTDIIITPDEKRLLIAAEEFGVVAFDLETRELSILRASDPGVEYGEFNGKVEGLMLHDQGLWVAETGWSALFLLDAETGETLRRVSLDGMDIAPVGIRPGVEPEKAIVLSNGTEPGLWEVDLAAGEAKRMFAGPSLELAMQFCVDYDDGYALVVDRDSDYLESGMGYGNVGVIRKVRLTDGDSKDVLRW